MSFIWLFSQLITIFLRVEHLMIPIKQYQQAGRLIEVVLSFINCQVIQICQSIISTHGPTILATQRHSILKDSLEGWGNHSALLSLYYIYNITSTKLISLLELLVHTLSYRRLDLPWLLICTSAELSTVPGSVFVP